MSDTAQNGKGSRPRNCFSKEYHNNYADIEWGHKNPKTIDDYWDKPSPSLKKESNGKFTYVLKR